jgi:hypothetical protein
MCVLACRQVGLLTDPWELFAFWRSFWASTDRSLLLGSVASVTAVCTTEWVASTALGV